MKSRLTLGITIMFAALMLSMIPAATVSTQQAAAQSICNWAQFVTDVTVPDNTVETPSTTFTKTWRLKNIGTCTWTTSYSLVFDSGTQMGGPASVHLPNSVAPGSTVDVSVTLTSPNDPGNYIGYWKFQNASGVRFGIGSSAANTWWVEINVSQPYGVIYDFTSNLCSGNNVRNDTDKLPCPGTNGSSAGFALTLANPIMENGVPALAPGILMGPQQEFNGFVFDIFPPMTFLRGDLFQSTLSCQNGAFSCYVRYVLQYKTKPGLIYTLWTWDEKYDGLTYNADVKLNSLDGQTVSLILGVRALGSAVGDRALWIHPVVVRQGVTVSTPVPTATLGPGTPTVTPTAVAGCNKAKFIADVTIPDATVFAPGAPFVKTWRIKNVGSCTWTTAYSLVFDSGNPMGAPASINLPNSVPPSATVDLSINLTAPNTGGQFVGYWKFNDPRGVPFGVGVDALHDFWVEINVNGPTATPTLPVTPTPATSVPPPSGAAFDFGANACSAAWFSGSGSLPCPGTDGDSRGFVLQVNNPTLESGAAASGLGLVTFPQNVFNGYIQGIYPPYTVKAGDRFRSIVNCSFGQTTCSVIFRLDYQTGSGPITTFWAFAEKYDGLFYQSDLDLSPLVGQNVKFILTVLANGSAAGDRALWVNPIIYNAGTSGSATADPSATPTLGSATPIPVTTPAPTDTSQWVTYQDAKYAFSFRIPPGSALSGQSDNAGRVYVPIHTPGTNLREKYVDVSVVDGASTCKSPYTSSMATSQNITLNGIAFLKETGFEGAAGNFYDWIAYSTTKGTSCISLTFVMHSIDPGVLTTPPPVYDKNDESAVFTTIMSTYANQ